MLLIIDYKVKSLMADERKFPIDLELFSLSASKGNCLFFFPPFSVGEG